MSTAYDAILVVSFGGPECRDDVIPFLENVLRGKNVPRARMLEVAEHYYEFDGMSPINQQNRELIEALRQELQQNGISLPIYWGNRNWHPLLPDTLREMAEAGVRRALAYVTSAYSSYSGCRQYLEDLDRARAQVETEAPQVDKIRAFFNHPGFIETLCDLVGQAWDELSVTSCDHAEVVFSAHSIPQAMADGCRYEEQLKETCRLVSQQLELPNWHLVYQSRSGPPTQPWLEPDVCDYLRQRHSDGLREIVISPVGFLSDHLEVGYDLDTEAGQLCQELGIRCVRAATPGTHPRFVQMLRELIEERLNDDASRVAIGDLGPVPDQCARNCCPSGRPVARS